MTRRRLTISLIIAGSLAAAGTAATTALALRDDPAGQQPAAFEPATTTPRPVPSLPDYGREACQQLFTGDALDVSAVTDALNRDDPQAANQWVQDLYDTARRAATAEHPGVRDAAAGVRTAIEDGNGTPIGDVVADLTGLPGAPVIAFATECMEADLVEQRLIDRWRDTLSQ